MPLPKRIEEANCGNGEYADSVGQTSLTRQLGYTTFDNPAGNYTPTDLDGKTALSSRAAQWAAFQKANMVVVSAGNSRPTDGARSVLLPMPVLAIGAVNVSSAQVPFSSPPRPMGR
jgi:subtilisin family serine protease